MYVQFTFNDGNGVEPNGAANFASLDAAKREAMLALAQSLQEDVRRSGEIVGSVAGLDAQGTALFAVSMRITIEELAPQSFADV